MLAPLDVLALKVMGVVGRGWFAGNCTTMVLNIGTLGDRFVKLQVICEETTLHSVAPPKAAVLPVGNEFAVTVTDGMLRPVRLVTVMENVTRPPCVTLVGVAVTATDKPLPAEAPTRLIGVLDPLLVPLGVLALKVMGVVGSGWVADNCTTMVLVIGTFGDRFVKLQEICVEATLHSVALPKAAVLPIGIEFAVTFTDDMNNVVRFVIVMENVT